MIDINQQLARLYPTKYNSPHSLFGIIGSSGRGGVFSPLDLTNLKAWYDASDISTITKDGSDRVSQWDDKSGNSLHLVQATGGSQPLWQSANQNGLDDIAFSGSRWMDVDWSAISQPVTIFIALKLPTNDGSTRMIYDAFATPQFALFKDGSVANKFFFEGGITLSFTEAGFTGTWRYVTSRHNTTSSTLSIDGVEKISGNDGTATMRGITVGATFVKTVFTDAVIGEIAVVDGLSDAGEIANMESYLANKWGL